MSRVEVVLASATLSGLVAVGGLLAYSATGHRSFETTTGELVSASKAVVVTAVKAAGSRLAAWQYALNSQGGSSGQRIMVAGNNALSGERAVEAEGYAAGTVRAGGGAKEGSDAAEAAHDESWQSELRAMMVAGKPTGNGSVKIASSTPAPNAD